VYLKIWHCIALLFIAVAAAYFFSLSAGFNSVDDLSRVMRLDNRGQLDILRLFFPHGRSYYYRPLGTLTFFLDRDIWGSTASFMHLENMLIHFGSVVMVFLLTRRVASVYSVLSLIPPFGAALLFAWHPLTAEAVCWISGRYDLLACFFLLVTVWLLIGWLQNNNRIFAALSTVSLLAACLAKEVAVFALPGLVLLILFGAGEKPILKALRERVVCLIFPVVAVCGYFLMRHAATARDTGVKTALSAVVAGEYDFLDKLRVAFKVYGFYLKKLFIPWPLNFGIVEISGFYIVLGLLLALLLLWLLLQRDLLSALAITSFCVLSPALLVVFGRMAWTPLAERYLYSSVALFAPSVALWLTGLIYRVKDDRRRWFLFLLSAVLLVFFGSTMHRSWVWQDNERLYLDTVAKSPTFEPARAELASALIAKGKSRAAEVILRGMQTGKHSESYIVDDLNLAIQLIEQGKLQQAYEQLLPLLDREQKKRYVVLQYLLKVNNLRLDRKNISGFMKRQKMYRQSLEWLLEQYQLRPFSFTLYRIGKIQLALGRNNEALVSFQRAYEGSSENSHYRDAARKFIENLERK